MRMIFASLFLLAGVFFVFVTPPFQNPDEPMHFYRSYQLAKSNLFSESNSNNEYGGQIPLAMRSLVVDSGIEHYSDPSYKFHLSVHKLLSYRYGGEKVFVHFPSTAIYSPVAYVPSIVAHQVTALVHAPMLVALYLARIFSLLVVLLAFLFALKYSPLGRYIFFAVGLLPMTIASAASVSADAMTLAISVVFTAAVLRISLHDKKMYVKWLILISFLALCVGLVKQAQIALLPLLILPILINKHYRNKRAYIWIAVTLLVSLVVFFLWYSKVSSIILNTNPLIQPDLQRAFIIVNPFEFILVPFLNTYFTSYPSRFIIDLFGNFGWLTTPMPALFVLISAFTLYFSIGLRGSGDIALKHYSTRTKLILRVLLVGLFVATTTVISIALYIYWTPYKLPYIEGIQGRYFIPILPLLLIPFVGIPNKRQTYSKYLLTACIFVVLVVAGVTIYSRFYI